jgi:hypothetical protein
MTTHNSTHKHIVLQAQDQQRRTSQVRLTVNEHTASGTLAILTPTGTVTQQFDLTQIKKGRQGTQLTCTVQGAPTTLTLNGVKDPPEIRVVTTWLVPIFAATYRLSRTEHQRLVQWINALTIDALA